MDDGWAIFQAIGIGALTVIFVLITRAQYKRAMDLTARVEVLEAALIAQED